MSKWKLIRPAAGRNLVTNPSFETNATGWSALAGGAISSFNPPSIVGAYSNIYGTKIGGVAFSTSPIAGDGAYYALTMTAGTTYYVKMKISAIDANYVIKVGIATTLGAYVASQQLTVTQISSTNLYRFQEVSFSAAISSTATYHLRVEAVSGTPSGGFLLYNVMIDGVQITATNISTYIDGDQPVCVWEGAPHNSISRTRFSLPTSRDIGLLVDLQDDYGFYIREAKGVGMAGLDWGTIKRGAPGAGSVVTSVRTPARGISLKGTLIGTSHTNINDTRNQIINDVSPYLVPFVNGAPQPVHLRYEGTQKTLELLCNYKDGLDKDFNEVETYTDEFALQFIAHDNPYWQEVADTTAVLDTQDTIAVYGVAAQAESDWGALGITALGGVTPEVWAVKWGPDGKLYFGGTFTQVNAVANTAYIARYNPVTAGIESLSAVSLGAAVNALFFAPDNTLYVGGAFTNVTDANGDYVTMWKDTVYGGTGAWVSLVAANPLNGEVRCFALDGATGNILIGGDFTTGSGATLNRITSYDGAFNALGTGADAAVRAVAYLADGRDTILIGGSFANAGGVAAAYIAAYTATDGWFNVGTLNAAVYAIVAYEQGAIVGGAFITFDTEPARRILKINEITSSYTGWEALGPGVGNTGTTVYTIAIYNGRITTVTNSAVYNTLSLVKWIGNAWCFDDIHLEGAAGELVYAIDINEYGEIAIGMNTAPTTLETLGSTAITLKNGASETYPKLQITRSGGTYARLCSIKSQDGNAIYFIGTGTSGISILDNETIEIDLINLAVTSNYGRTLNAAVGSASIALYPGQNNILVLCATDATITCTIVYRPQYHSYDAAEDAS